jgi:hypothetical protein
MKLISRLPAWLRNKYFIAFAAFCVIMLFLDKNDIFTQFGRKKELHNLQTSKNFISVKMKLYEKSQKR